MAFTPSEQMENIKFVQEVEKHPCLYNFTLPEYMRRDKVDKAWSDVGSKVNLPAHQCKEKWKNLRCVLSRNLKGLKTTTNRKRKPYYLASYMKFTVPFIKRMAKPKSEMSDNSDEEPQYDGEQEESHHSYDDPLTPQVDTSYSYAEPEISITSQVQQSSNHRANETGELYDSVMDYYEAKKTEYDENQDAKKMFLLSLLPDLKSMTDAQMRTFKRRVLSLVDDILSED